LRVEVEQGRRGSFFARSAYGGSITGAVKAAVRAAIATRVGSARVIFTL
jgi:hypothetical protein